MFFLRVLTTFLLLYLFLATPLQAQLHLVNINEKVGMENAQGKIVISPIYQNLGWPHSKDLFKEQVIGYQINGLWGLMDSTGRRITQPIYSHIAYWGNGRILANQNLRARRESINGIIDPSGKIIIPFEYAELTKLSGLTIIAKKKLEGIFKVGIIDFSNTSVLPIEYAQIAPFEDNLLLVNTPQGKSGLYQLAQNRFISELAFDSLVMLKPNYFLAYQEGWAKLMNHEGQWLLADSKPRIVNTDSGIYYRDFVNWEVVNTKGATVKKLAFDYLEAFKPEIYLATQSGKQAFVDSQGKALHPYLDKIKVDKSQNFHQVQKNGLWGLMDTNGNFLLSPNFTDVHLLKYFIGVYDGQAWLVYNYDGRLISEQGFQELGSDSEGLLSVKKRGKWGFIDKTGEQVIPCIYEEVNGFQSGVAQVYFYGAWGLINTRGRWVLLPSFKSIQILTANLFITQNTSTKHFAIRDTLTTLFESSDQLSLYDALLLKTSQNGKKGLCTWLGKEVLPTEYDSISPLLNDSIRIVFKEGKIGVLNTKGRFLITPTKRFQSINDFNEDLLAVKIDGNEGFVDLEAKLRIANRYEAVKRFQEGIAPVRLRGQWALINKKEQLVAQPAFDWVEGFQQGLSLVKKGDRFGIIDQSGKPTVSIEYDSIRRTTEGHFISYKNNKIGLIDGQGKLAINNKFDSLEDLGGGLLKVERRGKFGIVNQSGLDVIPIIYDVITPDIHPNQFITLIRSGWKKL